MLLSEDVIKLWSPSRRQSEQNPLYYDGRGEDRPVIVSSSWQLTCSHIQQRARGCHCGVADHSETSMRQNALHILTWKPAEKLFRVFLSNRRRIFNTLNEFIKPKNRLQLAHMWQCANYLQIPHFKSCISLTTITQMWWAAPYFSCKALSCKAWGLDQRLQKGRCEWKMNVLYAQTNYS